MSRDAFEKAYQPDAKKSPFPFFKFNEETNLYEGYSFDEREVSLINAAWWAWQEQQVRINNIKTKAIEQALKLGGMDERNKRQAEMIKDQQKRIDAALRISEKMAKATNSVAMFSYELHQALKGDMNEQHLTR